MIPGSPYARAPIVEAILDIQVDLKEELAVESLQKCRQNVRRDYPETKRTQDVVGEFSFGPGVSSSASAESSGFIFVSVDKKQLFQAKRNGFTFNQLAPYPGWDAFLGEAKRLWDEYYKVARPRGYKRLALRYIDRFDFPVPKLKLEEYFRTYPELSGDLPQLMGGFFFQCQLPIDDIQSIASITQTTVQPNSPGQSSIILDVDLFRVESLPRGDEMWSVFETLRLWKNRIFEACITDATREFIR